MNQNTRQKILWLLLILFFILHLFGIFYGAIKASEKKDKDLPTKKMERLTGYQLRLSCDLTGTYLWRRGNVSAMAQVREN